MKPRRDLLPAQCVTHRDDVVTVRIPFLAYWRWLVCTHDLTWVTA